MTPRNYSSLNVPFRRAHIKNWMSLPLVNGSNQSWPEKWLLFGSVCFKFWVKLLSRCLWFLHCEKAKLFIYCILLSLSPREDLIGELLRHLTEMAPVPIISGHWALEHMWAGWNHVCLCSIFRIDDPITERLHKTIPLWTSRLNNNHDAIVI